MEAVVERENMWAAWKRVKANKGAAGVDGMTVAALPAYLRASWPRETPTPTSPGGGIGPLSHPGPVRCGNGLTGAIVFTKGYKEPEAADRSARKTRKEESWTAFFTTDLTLTGAEVVKRYIGRWAIEVFFKEAKQRLGLGREQGRSFAAQVFSVLQACFRYTLLAYLLEQDEQAQTIGDMFRQLEEETGNLTFLELLRHHFATFLKTILDTMADFCDPGRKFRSYLDIITNTFNQFSPLQGCEN